MNRFRSLTHGIGQWWHNYYGRNLSARFSRMLHRLILWSKLYNGAKLSRQTIRELLKLSPTQLLQMALPPRHKRKSHRGHPSTSGLVLLVILVSLTSTIGYRFYNEPQLAVNTIAPQTLRAPATAIVEDTKTTDENRRAARTGAIPVLMIEPTVNQQIYQSLQRLIERGNELRQIAGSFPFVETSILSTTTQQYIRQTSQPEWELTLKNAERANTTSALIPTVPPGQSDAQKRLVQQLVAIELQNYRRTHSAEDYAALRQVISRTRQRYTEALAHLSAIATEGNEQVYDRTVFALTDAEWEQTKVGIRQALERVLQQGIPPGLPDLILRDAIRTQASIDVPNSALPLSSAILMAVIKPNLVQDPEETRLRAEQAALAVEPEMVEIRRGEIIVRAGEVITQPDFVLLDHFGMSRRSINWLGLIGLGAWVSVAIFIFLRAERYFHPGLRRRDYVLVWLLTMTAPLMLLLGLPTLSLPLVGLLVGSFYGSALGLTAVGLLAVTLPFGVQISWSALIASTVSSLVGAYAAGRLRSREELALLGIGVGLLQGATYLIASLIVSSPGLLWYGILSAAGLETLIGFGWSVVALGISPYLEQLFDLVTPVRLAELANPNRPMLKRLASEAPGTFQHTLFVSSLAEAAARALGCNVELVRAGTLYHDIGKMHDPLGFIENQMGGPNKHDSLSDPWVSADIIKKHVSEGLVMARKCRLPKAVQAFIPEHQGTMLITYFYHEAMQRSQQNPGMQVNEQDFRYDGPIPQSRETGIVMLADSCEAALRSLKDATPEDALAMVNRILRARWQDNQLIDSGLNRAEVGLIAEIFVRVWQQFNHQRIAYPKLSPPRSSSLN